MELHCIDCENLVQLGADACATYVQPTMTWKGHDISVCKSTCEECKDYRSQIQRDSTVYGIKTMYNTLCLIYVNPDYGLD